MRETTFPTFADAKAAGFTMANLRYHDDALDFEGGYLLARVDLPAFARFSRVEYEDMAEAIDLAVEDGWTLNTHSDPAAEGFEDVSPGYAHKVAATDPALVYLTR